MHERPDFGGEVAILFDGIQRDRSDHFALFMWVDGRAVRHFSRSRQIADVARFAGARRGDAVVGGTVSKKLDVQSILTEARSDIECLVMAARQLPPEEGGPIEAMADAAGKKIEKALRQLGAEVAASHGAEEG